MSKGGWKSRNSNRFFITREGEFMNKTKKENTDNKKTKVIQKRNWKHKIHRKYLLQEKWKRAER